MAIVTYFDKYLKGNVYNIIFTILLVTKADNGNITVILNKQNYLGKMQKLLDDSSTYDKIELQGMFFRCPPPIFFSIKYAIEHQKLRDTCFFLSAQNKF